MLFCAMPAVAQTFRFTVDEYHKLAEAGILDADDRVLLLANEVDEYEGLPEARQVEIADSTLRYDRGPKFKAYARAEIAELWIVNLKENTIEVYRDPSGESYSVRRAARGNERVASSSFPDVKVTVSKIVA
jgi:hypothetical protein